MRLGRVRLRLEEGAQHRLRVERARRLQQEPGEVHAGDLETRIERERLAERAFRSDAVPGGAQRAGEDIPGLRVARRRGDGGARDSHGFRRIAGFPDKVRQQQLRAEVCGIGVEGPTNEPQRLVGLAARARLDCGLDQPARIPSGAAALRHAGEEIPQHRASGPDRAFSR